MFPTTAVIIYGIFFSRRETVVKKFYIPGFRIVFYSIITYPRIFQLMNFFQFFFIISL